DRPGVLEPDLALYERADRVDRPADLEQRSAADCRRVALHGNRRRLLNGREQVERGLRLTITELELREQNRDRLLLIAIRAGLRVVEPTPRDLRVAVCDRRARTLDQIVDALCSGRARRELRIQLGGGRVADLRRRPRALLEALRLRRRERTRRRLLRR